MGADAWRVCPQCAAKFATETERMEREVNDKYGKVPAEEYVRLLSEYENRTGPSEALREDYQIWMDEDGVFNVQYRCECTECNFAFGYTHREIVFWEVA